MSRLDDVRAALLPLKKRGLVHSVWPGGRRLTSLAGSVPQIEPIAIDLVFKGRSSSPQLGKPFALTFLSLVRNANCLVLTCPTLCNSVRSHNRPLL